MKQRVKTERIGVLLFPEDKEALERLSLSQGEPMAVVVRRLIRQAAAGQASEPGRGRLVSAGVSDVRNR